MSMIKRKDSVSYSTKLIYLYNNGKDINNIKFGFLYTFLSLSETTKYIYTITANIPQTLVSTLFQLINKRKEQN